MKTKGYVYKTHLDFRGKICEKKSAHYTHENMKTKGYVYKTHLDFRGKICEKKSAHYTQVNMVVLLIHPCWF